MLNVISANSVPQSVFRLIISALLLVLSASRVMVGLPLFVSQSINSIYFGPWSILVEDDIQTL